MTATKREVYTDRDRLRRLIQESPFDAVLATSRVNVTHSSGFYDPGMRTMPNRLHVVVWPVEGEPAFIVPQYRLSAETFIDDLRGYDFYIRDEVWVDPRGVSHMHRTPVALVAEVLREKGLEQGTIGVELESLPAGAFNELRQILPAATFLPCETLFDESRMVKTPAEIKLLADGGIATEKAIQASFARARVGVSSRELAAIISDALLRQGADEVAFLELDVYRAGVRHEHRVDPVDLQPGDLVRVDAGGYFDGYWSDVARMAVVGEATAEQRTIYARLFDVQRQIIHDILRPDVPGSQLFAETCRAFEGAGFELPWGMIVHGIGLYIHERPWVREVETLAMEPGTVVCVEAIGHEPGVEMWHVEDLIEITADGARELTVHHPADELSLITG